MTSEFENNEVFSASYELSPQLQEDVLWSEDVSGVLTGLPRNVVDLWNFCFTEMVNHAIDHSEGTEVSIHVAMTAANTEITVHDNGVGIFRKIQFALNLPEERQAVLELAKGKFTTDRTRHSGLGVFYSSRMLDSFQILSGTVYFSHEMSSDRDWRLEETEAGEGTTVFMKLSNTATRTTTEIFDLFSDGKTLGFNKTVVPMQLAQYGSDRLVSRSQAKRLLARLELFSYVVLDFAGVEAIGQGFADEIFRVFAKSHPQVKLHAIHTVPEVDKMISAVRSEALRQVKSERRATPISERIKIKP